MTRSTEPQKYADTWEAILVAAEGQEKWISISGDKPLALRLEFYSYRAAWNAEATRMEMKGQYELALVAKNKYRALCAYTALVNGDSLMLLHQAERRHMSVQLSGEKAFSIVDRSADAEYSTRSNANTPGVQKLGDLSPSLGAVNATDEQKREAEHKRDSGLVAAGYATPHEAQYFTQSEWEALTKKPAPEDLIPVFGTGFRDMPADNPIVNAVILARQQKELDKPIVD